jgi:pimeloyl-ACP methyl ester carboxylesterase
VTPVRYEDQGLPRQAKQVSFKAMNISTQRENRNVEVRFLSRPDGRIAYTVQGTGPLVVAVPGMGDLRSSYRELVGPLRDAGFRVAITDLRGQGDSDTTFSDYGDIATARDIVALIDELGGAAVVLGNSMGASAAAWAAAERPDAVAGLVSYAPLLREPKASAFARRMNHLIYHVLFARPWGASVWARFYGSVLNRGAKAPWLDQHVVAIAASLKRPGYLRALRRLVLALDHSVVEARIPEMSAPHRAFIGRLDRDYPDQTAEVDWLIGHGIRAELVDDAGHYTHTQRPDVTVPATLSFLAELRGEDGSSWKAPGGSAAPQGGRAADA